MAMPGEGNLALDTLWEPRESVTAAEIRPSFSEASRVLPTGDGTQSESLRVFVMPDEEFRAHRHQDSTGGGIGLHTVSVEHSDQQDKDFPESNNRLALLARKYASGEVNFSPEDAARLEMIHQKFDRRYNRYSARDWEHLEDAEALLNEIANELRQATE